MKNIHFNIKVLVFFFFFFFFFAELNETVTYGYTNVLGKIKRKEREVEGIINKDKMREGRK